MENISQTQKILTSKSEMIPDLQQALKDAVRRLEEAEKAVEQQRKVNELKSELAWTHVTVKEKVCPALPCPDFLSFHATQERII